MTIPATLFSIKSPVRGWGGDLDYTALERTANALPTELCACGGAAWIRLWPEPQPGYAHFITYDSICPSCQWQPTTEDFWSPDEAAAAWNAASALLKEQSQ